MSDALIPTMITESTTASFFPTGIFNLELFAARGYLLFSIRTLF
jgi:hypothetical protein